VRAFRLSPSAARCAAAKAFRASVVYNRRIFISLTDRALQTDRFRERVTTGSGCGQDQSTTSALDAAQRRVKFAALSQQQKEYIER